jgi:hypothetical protein
MRHAVVDITGEALADCAGFLCDHGLRITGSLRSGDGANNIDAVRLILSDDAGNILPEQCESGWHLVRIELTQEQYGRQRLVKLSGIEVVGEIEFAIDGSSRLKAAA